MRKFCKDCNHEPVCGSPHTEHTLGCDYWQKETVDAVPVVRCKECVNRHKSHACPMCYDEYFDIYDEYGYFDSDHTTNDFTEDDGFCNRGEKERRGNND